jgi:D-3-phosphoglycerate dehydrogenase / 2-oxoglutarate reductase
MGAVNAEWPIVILDDWDNVCDTSQAVRRLKQRFPVTVHSARLEPDALGAAIAGAAIVIPFRERSKLDAGLLARAEKLRLIAQTGGGAAHVDRACAAQRGITISITPGGSAQSVAELVLGLALAFEHRIVEGDRLIRGGEWRSLIGRDIGGKTLGLLGYGATAQAVALLA